MVYTVSRSTNIPDILDRNLKNDNWPSSVRLVSLLTQYLFLHITQLAASVEWLLKFSL